MGNIDLSGQVLDVKRLNFNGGKIEVNCPKCNKLGTVNLGSDMICYPKVGKAEDIFYYCEHCDEETESIGTYTLNASIDFEVK